MDINHLNPEPGADDMVRAQIESRGVTDQAVLNAMRRVPRSAFVPQDARREAHDDRPLPIGQRQTISQPFMVAHMTELLALTPEARVLEIGTGSGYQTAILAALAKHVVSVERHGELARSAAKTLQCLGFDNVAIHTGDGTLGWPGAAPYDAILVTAAAPSLPAALIAQLAEGGRLVCPVGSRDLQELLVVTRRRDQLEQESAIRCVFVPLIGEAGWADN